MPIISLDDYEAVIFDFDGTLVDSLGLWHEIDQIYLARFGLECPEDLSAEINGMSFTETAVYFKKRFNLPLSVTQIKRDWIELSHDYYMQDIKFKPGAKALLDKLIRRGIPVALATSNNAEITEPFFASRGIDGIGAYSYSCNCKNGKPDPEVYLNAASGLGVDPKNCLVFEDSVEGITGAKRAGMKVVAVADTYNKESWEEMIELADFYLEEYENGGLLDTL